MWEQLSKIAKQEIEKGVLFLIPKIDDRFIYGMIATAFTTAELDKAGKIGLHLYFPKQEQFRLELSVGKSFELILFGGAALRAHGQLVGDFSDGFPESLEKIIPNSIQIAKVDVIVDDIGPLR